MRILSERVFITTDAGIHRLLHDIPRFFMFFIEQLFLIFNQMLSIRAFGRRVNATCIYMYMYNYDLARNNLVLIAYRKYL